MITSVGYHFILSADQVALINSKIRTILENTIVESRETYACVWFHASDRWCSREVFRSQSELSQWYARKLTQMPLNAFMRQIVVVGKSVVVLLDCANERFYAIIHNANDLNPTLMKKQCARGTFIDIERQTIPVTPYKHDV